jgi:hypothetical protein
MSVDIFSPYTIVMEDMDQENINNSTDQNGGLSVTDENIRVVIGKYYTPTISESQKGVVITFVPKGHSGPEAVVWFETAKKGYNKKPIFTNRWVMVDCDLRGIHELLDKFFLLTQGDFDVTRITLSRIAHEVVEELHRRPN